nr:thioredoxin [Dehalococcoides mccartyi]
MTANERQSSIRRDTNTLRRNDMVMEITDQNFEAEVLKSAKPVLVDFWAPWCGPCRMVAPIIDKLSTKYEGKFKFCKLNVDENKTTAAQYRVMSIPTLLFFKGGQVADMVVGAVPESALSQKIDQLIQK